jgi:hypothetical protein
MQLSRFNHQDGSMQPNHIYLDTLPKNFEQTLSNLELQTTFFQWRLVEGVALLQMKELVISVKSDN